MTEYKVIWVIDVDADSPREAAEKALAIHRNPDSIATVFTVTDKHGGETLIDLNESKYRTVDAGIVGGVRYVDVLDEQDNPVEYGIPEADAIEQYDVEPWCNHDVAAIGPDGYCECGVKVPDERYDAAQEARAGAFFDPYGGDKHRWYEEN